MPQNSKEPVVAEEVTEDEKLLLPQTNDYLNLEKEYRRFLFQYEAAIAQITSRLELLSKEFSFGNDRNPIEDIKSRVKSAESIIGKMKRKGLPMTMSALSSSIFDIAGVRVTCPFVSDVYLIARLLMRQKDVQLLKLKDYIREPKENGYRSLHLVLLMDVCLSEQIMQVPIEVQIRTIAMNFWASAEHQLRYKKDFDFTEEMQCELKECADLMAKADEKMQKLSAMINGDDSLFEDY